MGNILSAVWSKLQIKVVLSLGCIFLLAGCDKNSTEKEPSSRIFRMNIAREPPTLDPRRGSELIGSTMHFILFEGLMRLNPDGSVSPAQAKTVEISDDRKTYTFHLRGTLWSDGTLVTSADFAKAWKKILSPHFPAANAHLLYPIKNAEGAKKGWVSLDAVGITTPDEKTLVVELENPAPYFLDLVSFCVFFPVNHKIDETDPNWTLEAGSQFTSNGPFKLAKWKHTNEILLEKNPLYWQADQISLDQIHVSMVADENTALHMYENNELDMVGQGISPIPSDALMKFQHDKQLATYNSPGTTIICFNNVNPIFKNKNIRKAFAYAINRKEIVNNLTQLGEEVATSIIPPVLKNNTQLKAFNDHDVFQAKKLFEKGLKELGLTSHSFPQVTYVYSSSEGNHKLAQTLQNQWAQGLGITVKLQNTEHKVLLDKLMSRDYEIAQSIWLAQYNDPMNILERFKSKQTAKNYPGWEHAEYIRLLEKCVQDSTPEERMKTLEAAEMLFMEEMPLTPLYHWKSAFLLKPHVSNTRLLPNGGFDYSRLCVSLTEDPHDQ